MNRLDRRARALALLLAFVAGSVDAIGFLSFGGFFVSFMSGNSTRLGVAVAAGAGHQAAIAGGLILLFVIGVALGSHIGHRAGTHRQAVLTGFEAVLLAVAALLHGAGAVAAGTAAMVIAMAIANATFERDGEIAFGITYMTGALVRVGQNLAAIARGGDRWAWLVYARLWAALATGAVAGASIHAVLGVAGLWVLSALVACVAMLLAVHPLGNGAGER
jgi:uncharacterized membrane protein YoaK (UPF0700 family)